ncbi:MAG: amidohydrolase [Blastocatellia bacterium]
MTISSSFIRKLFLCCLLALTSNCSKAPGGEVADVLLTGAKVYTFVWDEPTVDGATAKNAPRQTAGWRPDAEAIAIKGDRIIFVGSASEAEKHRGSQTQVVDLKGATIIPGLVDSHTHVAGLGERQSQVDLTGVNTEAEAIEKVVAFAAKVPAGEWIIGQGWDEGAWAANYPTMKGLSERAPNHPVYLASLHGFAGWGNRLAFERAGITRTTAAPVGGQIVKDANGEPTGILLNRAVTLLSSKVPPTTDEQFKSFVLAGLEQMARDGYVAVHEAGVDSRLMKAFESLETESKLPVRVYAMLSARDAELCRAWLKRGPKLDGKLVVRSVKAYYDAALGSRGARLLADYSDKPGHRGISGAGYGFDQQLVAEMMKAGFQVGIHAIGDAGNRETLNFIEKVIAEQPSVKNNRNRIEHAQVIHPDDFARFAKLEVIASMEPPHCVEDKTWAEERLGADRVKGAYAWRTLRKAGARLIFNSDLTGSDHSIFYGLHAATTRRDKQLQPMGGWFHEERLTAEESVRAYTVWNAFAAFGEKETGVIAAGRWADLTAMDIDPLEVGTNNPALLLRGKIKLTMVGGRIVFTQN